MNYIETIPHSNSIYFTCNTKTHLNEYESSKKNNITIKQSETVSFEVDTSILHILKMTFIYSAIMDGWRVERLNNNKFIFSKKNVTKHITLQSFINKHLHTQNLLISK